MKKKICVIIDRFINIITCSRMCTKTDNAGETSAPAVSESQAAKSTEQAAESTEQTADVQNTADQGEEKTITGTIDEIKDSCLLSQMSLAQHMNSALRQHRKDWKM